MSRPRKPTAITSDRAGRLFKLLLQIRSTAKTRSDLVRKLKITIRGFYRDLELLRGLGIKVETAGENYRLGDPLADALARLPFPDPGLSLRDALLLTQGRTDAHRKLRARVAEVVGSKVAFSALPID